MAGKRRFFGAPEGEGGSEATGVALGVQGGGTMQLGMAYFVHAFASSPTPLQRTIC